MIILRKLKRVVALLLVFVMVLSMPINTFAGQSPNNPGHGPSENVNSGIHEAIGYADTVGIRYGFCVYRHSDGTPVMATEAVNDKALDDIQQVYCENFYSTDEFGSPLYIMIGVKDAENGAMVYLKPEEFAARVGSPPKSTDRDCYMRDESSAAAESFAYFAAVATVKPDSDLVKNPDVFTVVTGNDGSPYTCFTPLSARTFLTHVISTPSPWITNDIKTAVSKMLAMEPGAPLIGFCAEVYATSSANGQVYTCRDLSSTEIAGVNLSAVNPPDNPNHAAFYFNNNDTVNDLTLKWINAYNTFYVHHGNGGDKYGTRIFEEFFKVQANRGHPVHRPKAGGSAARLNHAVWVDSTGAGRSAGHVIYGSDVVMALNANIFEDHPIGPPPGSPKPPEANFTWNLNSKEIPLANSHAQDNTKIVKDKDSISGYDIGLSDFQFQTAEGINGSIAAWNLWFTEKKFDLNSPICQLEFTVSPTTDSTHTGLVSDTNVFNCTFHTDKFSPQAWLNALNTGKHDAISVCMPDDAKPWESYINTIDMGELKTTWGSNANVDAGQIHVEYQVTGKLIVDGGGTIPLGNNQIHSATYGFQTDVRTYHLWQMTANAHAQVKADEIGESKWDAVNGVPTTEDLFVSMGGSEFIVNLQYRYCVDDYVRKYHLKTKPINNFMYYKTGAMNYDDSGDSPVYTQLVSPPSKTIDQKPEPNSNNTGTSLYTKNNGFTSDAMHAQYEDLKKRYTEYGNKIVELLNGVDHNVGGYITDDDYAVYCSGDGWAFDWDKGLTYNNSTGRPTAYVRGDSIHGAVQNDTVNKLHKFMAAFNKAIKDIEAANDDGGAAGAHLADKLNYSSGPIWLFSTREYRDYDSNRSGGVTIKLSFGGTRADDYNISTKDYHNYGKYTKLTSASHDTHYIETANASCTDFGGVVLCDQYKDTPHDGKYPKIGGCSYEESAPTPEDPDHKETCDFEGIGSDHPNTNHTHYGHKRDGSGDSKFNAGDECWEPTPEAHSTNHTPKECWGYSWDLKFSTNYNAGPHLSSGSAGETVEIAHNNGEGNGLYKVLSYEGDFQQVFAGVKYMDILECNVYRLSGGVIQEKNGVKGKVGLDSILGSLAPNAVNRNDSGYDVLTLACATKGFQLLDIEKDLESGLDEGCIPKWFRTPGEGFTDKSDDDESYAGMPYTSTNSAVQTYTGKQGGVWRAVSATDLAKIGRVSNTYTDNISPVKGSRADSKEFTAAWCESDIPFLSEHAFSVDGSNPDHLEFMYDPNAQGGRSHVSFNGFLKQALALTFYGTDNVSNRTSRTAVTETANPYLAAYRNYLLVESDFLMFNGNPMLGFQYDTSFLDTLSSDGSSLTDDRRKYGLSQALLSASRSITSGSDDIYTFMKLPGNLTGSQNDGYWKAAKYSKDPQGDANTNAGEEYGLNRMDIAVGNAGSPSTQFGSNPNDKLQALSYYTETHLGEKPDRGDIQPGSVDEGNTGDNSIVVAMEMNEAYAEWTPTFINGEYTLSANAATAPLMHEEDKFISNINEKKRQLEDRNKPDERMDQVGYRGNGDAGVVGHDFVPKSTASGSLMTFDDTYIAKGFKFADESNKFVCKSILNTISFMNLSQYTLAEVTKNYFVIHNSYELANNTGAGKTRTSLVYRGFDKPDTVAKQGFADVNDPTVVQPINEAAWFPYFAGLNIYRTLANGSYGGFNSALIYEQVCKVDHTEMYKGTVALAEETLQSFDMKEDAFTNIGTTLHKREVESGLSDAEVKERLGETVDTAIVVSATYTGHPNFASPKNNKTNNVRIYNPVAATFTSYIDSSKYLPDGKNRFNLGYLGYSIRDTRLDTKFLANGETKDSYIFTEEIEELPEIISNDEVRYKLRIPSAIKTETFTDEDTVTIETKEIGVINVTGDFRIESDGNYTIKVNDGTNQFEFDKVLSAGDIITWDGKSIYLTTNNSSASNATFTNMCTVVTKYWNDKLSGVVEDTSVDVDVALMQKTADSYLSQIDTALKYSLAPGTKQDAIYISVLNTCTRYINKIIEGVNGYKDIDHVKNQETVDVLNYIIEEVKVRRDAVKLLIDGYEKFSVELVDLTAPKSLEVVDSKTFYELLKKEEYGYITEENPVNHEREEDYKYSFADYDEVGFSWYDFSRTFPGLVMDATQARSSIDSTRLVTDTSLSVIQTENIPALNNYIAAISNAQKDKETYEEEWRVLNDEKTMYNNLLDYIRPQRAQWGTGESVQQIFTLPNGEQYTYELQKTALGKQLCDTADFVNSSKWDTLLSQWSSLRDDGHVCVSSGHGSANHKCYYKYNTAEYKRSVIDSIRSFYETYYPSVALETDKENLSDKINPNDKYGLSRQVYTLQAPELKYIKDILSDDASPSLVFDSLCDLVDDSDFQSLLSDAAFTQLDNYVIVVRSIDEEINKIEGQLDACLEKMAEKEQQIKDCKDDINQNVTNYNSLQLLTKTKFDQALSDYNSAATAYNELVAEGSPLDVAIKAFNDKYEAYLEASGGCVFDSGFKYIDDIRKLIVTELGNVDATSEALAKQFDTISYISSMSDLITTDAYKVVYIEKPGNTPSDILTDMKLDRAKDAFNYTLTAGDNGNVVWLLRGTNQIDLGEYRELAEHKHVEYSQSVKWIDILHQREVLMPNADADRTYITDNPNYNQPVLDENGNPTFDSNGNVVYDTERYADVVSESGIAGNVDYLKHMYVDDKMTRSANEEGELAYQFATGLDTYTKDLKAITSQYYALLAKLPEDPSVQEQIDNLQKDKGPTVALLTTNIARILGTFSEEYLSTVYNNIGLKYSSFDGYKCTSLFADNANDSSDWVEKTEDGTYTVHSANENQIRWLYNKQIASREQAVLGERMAIDILTELTNVTIKTPHLKVEEAAAAHVVPANDSNTGYFDVPQGATMEFGIGLVAKPGSVMNLTFPIKTWTNGAVDSSYTPDVTLVTTPEDSFNKKVTISGDKLIVKLEAKNSATLSSIKMQFKKDLRFVQFNENYITFDPTWLLASGNPIGAEYTSSMSEGVDVGVIEARGKLSLNKYVFDANGSDVRQITSTSLAKLTIVQTTKTDGSSPTSDASNPHKVPNANWRYYLVGATVNNGSHVVTSMSDPVLYEDSTVLPFIREDGTYWTIGSVMADGGFALALVNGEWHLTTANQGMQHKLIDSTTIVTKFDTFTLGYIDELQADKEVTVQPLKVLFSDGYVTRDKVLASTNAYPKEDLYNNYYEALFQLFGDSGRQLPSGETLTSPLFYVECARNVTYRFHYDSANDCSDITLTDDNLIFHKHYIKIGDGKYVDEAIGAEVNVQDDAAFEAYLKEDFGAGHDGILITKETTITEEMRRKCVHYKVKEYGMAWMADWFQATIDLASGDYELGDLYDEEQKELVQNNVLSLDDEFQIYFDNTGNLCSRSASNNGVPVNPSGSMLGEGWNVDITNINGNGYERQLHNYTTKVMGMYQGWWDSIKHKENNELYARYHGSDSDQDSLTETSTWIYAKYVMFNRPVYTFGDKPTKRAYEFGSGEANTPVYHAAGTPIYLGTYETSTMGDNSGRFDDYGLSSPYIDDDGNTQNFVYNFWCPVSVGELSGAAPTDLNGNNGVNKADALVCTYHVIAINHENLGGLSLEKLESGHASADSFAAGLDYNADLKVNNSYSTGHAGNFTHKGTVGRIGALTIVESNDPRYSDSFKMTSLSTDIKDFLIYPLIRKIAEYSNIQSKDGSQRAISLDPYDIRGRLAACIIPTIAEREAEASSNGIVVREDLGSEHGSSLVYKEDSENNRKYSSYNSYNTYGSIWFKSVSGDGFGGLWDSKHQDVYDYFRKIYIDVLPLTPKFNFHSTFNKTPVKVGYDLWLTLDSIGNYFGTSTSTDYESESVNGNMDYEQYKVQVRPFYQALDAERASGGSSYTGPVDVYMRRGDTYVKVFSGCDAFDAKGSTDSICKEHNINDMLQVIFHNYFPLALETNKAKEKDGTYVLDENMKRRSVTEKEAKITYDVTHASDFDTTRSLLTPVISDAESDGINYSSEEQRYVFGCTQLLQLRDRVMTYVGGPTAALDYMDSDFPNVNSLEGKRHAQKWYFALGLPSSAVFVPHGEELNSRNVLKSGYVALSVDVVANGNVWTIHYESDVSKFVWTVDGKPYTWDKWNPNIKLYPWLVPVTIYDIESTSIDDLNTQGSH